MRARSASSSSATAWSATASSRPPWSRALGPLVVVGEERRRAYDRVHLSSVFDGTTADELTLGAPDLYDTPGVELVLGDTVVALDTAAGTATTASGREIAYRACVARHRVVPVRAADPRRPTPPARSSTARSTTSTPSAAWAAGATTGVVVGGGLLGLEAANALRLLGIRTTVVEFAPRLMAVQLDDGGGRALRRHVEALGLDVRTGAAAAAVRTTADGRVAGLSFAEGDDLDADMVVFAAGIRPRDQLGRDAGLEVGERGGIVVDDRCATSAPDVYAIGEVACHGGRVYGLVAPGLPDGRGRRRPPRRRRPRRSRVPTCRRRSSCSASTSPAPATRTPRATTSCSPTRRPARGSASWSAPRARCSAPCSSATPRRTRCSCRPCAARCRTPDVLGLLRPIGRRGGHGPGRPARRGRRVLVPQRLVRRRASRRRRGLRGRARASRAARRPAPAAARASRCSRSSIDARLAASGKVVVKRLCAHFAMTRPELFEVVRVTGIRTFAELVARHGEGRGCEICKPAVASMFASLSSGYILDGEQASLQDSNDHFLANIQRDGTYSVVPRVPGGEITPAQLIAIGEVARDFGLYSKITGGQRIDLFGARVEELPLHLEPPARRRPRVRPRLRQGDAHREVVRRHDVVPLRRAGLRADGHRPRAALPRPALTAQDQARRVRLRPRVRRGPEQGRRRDRHRARAGTCTSAATAGCGRSTPSCSPRTSTRRRSCARSTAT